MTRAALQGDHDTANWAPPNVWWLIVTLASAIGATTVLLVAPVAYSAAVTAFAAIAAVVVGIHDQRTRRIPNAAVANIALFAVIQLAATAIIRGPLPVADAVVAAAVMLIATTAAAAAGWSGFGDAKLLVALVLCLGAVMGWYALYLLPLSLIFDAAYRLLRRQHGRHPFGPAIALATALIGTIHILA